MDPWVAAGLASLTGRPDGPGLVPAAATVEAITAMVATAPVEAPLALLGERAALAGWSRRGTTSCGAGTRLLPTPEGWVAVNLARPDDVAAMPAWLGLSRDPVDPWGAVVDSGRTAADLVDAGVPLGLAVARLPEAPPQVDEPVRPRRVSEAPPLAGSPLVVDLSSLWAGPLCSHLLSLGGARVVKVESTRRPDGGRLDGTGFFDLLNHGKASVALDLDDEEGRVQLHRLLRTADVVIEGSRPRALRQWGIDADDLLAAEDGPRVWCSVTAHGRDVDAVGFGDDAAVAGGLAAWDDEGPVFLADAVADPLTGIAAHAAITGALADGGRWLLDAALARVAASVASPPRAATEVADPPRPGARTLLGRAAELGADTDAVLAGLS
ncbi:MAG TPA: CoA transferase [Acidimicrobiales bacterium]|nr:CoA transferase [Acidimicrobiales bacterium]